jgi:hypothetical protein
MRIGAFMSPVGFRVLIDEECMPRDVQERHQSRRDGMIYLEE